MSAVRFYFSFSRCIFHMVIWSFKILSSTLVHLFSLLNALDIVKILLLILFLFLKEFKGQVQIFWMTFSTWLQVEIVNIECTSFPWVPVLFTALDPEMKSPFSVLFRTFFVKLVFFNKLAFFNPCWGLGNSSPDWYCRMNWMRCIYITIQIYN